MGRFLQNFTKFRFANISYNFCKNKKLRVSQKYRETFAKSLRTEYVVIKKSPFLINNKHL
jgi:hypothetical protein